MSRHKATTLDGDLQKVFGNPVPELYEAAAGHDASPELARALELRSFLALTEEQVARVHADMDPARDMDELSADKLRFDAQWLEAALEARDGYRAALGELLRTMPPPAQQARPIRTAPQRAGAAPGPPTVKAPDCPTSRPPT
ncbi:hypothetical protein [Streptomyces ardesiacus]|uniref:Uncharacterized protein n=1 Tax=Streptomyces ardesiacus TaxID=285564 RepID=A0ABW8H546_9ACTN